MDSGESSYRRFLAGDESAAEDIMEAYFFNLVYFVEGYVHDLHSAEDIAMDVMAELLTSRRRYDFSSSLKTYLCMRGRSKALDLLRRRKKLKFCGIEVAEDREDELADLEEKVLVDERSRMVNAAIEKLPEQLREAVRLCYFEGLSYENAARVMKKSRKQVDNLLYRAKKELYDILGEEGRQLI